MLISHSDEVTEPMLVRFASVSKGKGHPGAEGEGHRLQSPRQWSVRSSKFRSWHSASLGQSELASTARVLRFKLQAARLGPGRGLQPRSRRASELKVVISGFQTQTGGKAKNARAIAVCQPQRAPPLRAAGLGRQGNKAAQGIHEPVGHMSKADV